MRYVDNEEREEIISKYMWSQCSSILKLSAPNIFILSQCLHIHNIHIPLTNERVIEIVSFALALGLTTSQYSKLSRRTLWY